MKNPIQSEIIVKNHKVRIIRINDIDYISLTDLAKYANSEEPKIPIYTWIKNKDVILFLGLWEQMYNKDFKGIEFDTFKDEAGTNAFQMSPQKWINNTAAIGIVSKSGRYNSGTYAHPDIAFEFASWLSPEFKLYLIQEFQRLKKNEAYQNKIEWNANRLLTKANYLIHTDAVKNYIVPCLTEKQKNYIYAEEADVLNVALFGMTAKEWREKNREFAKTGNIRDYTDLLHLIILNNLESNNAEFIKQGINQRDRLIMLNESARNQMNILKDNINIKNISKLDVK